MEIIFLLTNTLKKKKITVVYGTTPEEDLLNVAENLRFPKRQANLHNLHIMAYGKTNEEKKKIDKAIRMRPAPLGGNCEGGSFHNLGNALTGRDRKLWNLRGEHIKCGENKGQK